MTQYFILQLILIVKAFLIHRGRTTFLKGGCVRERCLFEGKDKWEINILLKKRMALRLISFYLKKGSICEMAPIHDDYYGVRIPLGKGERHCDPLIHFFFTSCEWNERTVWSWKHNWTLIEQNSLSLFRIKNLKWGESVASVNPLKCREGGENKTYISRIYYNWLNLFRIYYLKWGGFVSLASLLVTLGRGECNQHKFITICWYQCGVSHKNNRCLQTLHYLSFLVQFVPLLCTPPPPHPGHLH